MVNIIKIHFISVFTPMNIIFFGLNGIFILDCRRDHLLNLKLKNGNSLSRNSLRFPTVAQQPSYSASSHVILGFTFSKCNPLNP